MTASWERVTIELGGTWPAIPDAAGVAGRLARSFPVWVEADTDDDVMRGIRLQGTWEPQETTAVIDVLTRTGDDVVLDFGAHVGWFSILAHLYGKHPVLAFEESAETRKLLLANAQENGVQLAIHEPWRVDNDSEMTWDIPGNVALLKADIEGQEHNAVRMCETAFAEGRIEYALLEISPVFTESGGTDCDYVDLVGRLLDWGYTACMIPDKGYRFNEQYRDGPIAQLLSDRRLPDRGWEKIIAGCVQANALFISPTAHR